MLRIWKVNWQVERWVSWMWHKYGEEGYHEYLGVFIAHCFRVSKHPECKEAVPEIAVSTMRSKHSHKFWGRYKILKRLDAKYRDHIDEYHRWMREHSEDGEYVTSKEEHVQELREGASPPSEGELVRSPPEAPPGPSASPR